VPAYADVFRKTGEMRVRIPVSPALPVLFHLLGESFVLEWNLQCSSYDSHHVRRE
jgi:hypothetical protein